MNRNEVEREWLISDPDTDKIMEWSINTDNEDADASENNEDQVSSTNDVEDLQSQLTPFLRNLIENSPEKDSIKIEAFVEVDHKKYYTDIDIKRSN